METYLLDADGVLLKKQPYFSLRIAEEYKVPYEAMSPFYSGEFKVCQIGKADMKEEIVKYLPKWNWDKGVDAFLEYWFTSDVEVDPRVLAIADQMRAKGIQCYLASDQEKYRGEYIWNNAGLKNHLDGKFLSYEVGASKSQTEFFKHVLTTLSVKPDDVMYWDDDEKNVAVAKSIDIDARFYKDFDEFKLILSTL